MKSEREGAAVIPSLIYATTSRRSLVETGVLRYETIISRTLRARTKGRGQGRLQGAQPHDRSRHARLSKARLKPPGGPPLPPDLRLCTNASLTLSEEAAWQPTSACGAPLWMKMVAARADLSESLRRAIVQG